MCVDCTNGCTETTLDSCVKYTGPDNTVIGICKGDPLYKVEAQIITYITTLLSSTSAVILSLTGNCDYFKSKMGTKAYNSSNIIDSLVTSVCDLKSMITVLQGTTVTPISVNAPCLGLSPNATRDDILKATASKVCQINTQVTFIANDYVKASELNTLIAQFLASNTPTSPTGITQQYTKMVPYTALPYFGPQSNFDSTGKGLVNNSYDKVYLCNGLNGTPDLRGRTVVGAISGVPGAALDAAVDPTNPANAGKNYAVKDKFGASSIVLNTTNLPTHTHPVTDPGHVHGVNAKDSNGVLGNDSRIPTPTDQGGVLATKSALTGISIGSTGGNAPHDNVQPSMAANFIIYLP